MKIKILGKIKRLTSGGIVVPEYVHPYYDTKEMIIKERHLSPVKAKNCFLYIFNGGKDSEIFRIKPSLYDDPAKSWDSILNLDVPHRFIIFEDGERSYWKVLEDSESLENVGNTIKMNLKIDVATLGLFVDCCKFGKLLHGMVKVTKPDEGQHWFFKGYVIHIEKDDRERSYEELKLEVANAVIKQDKRYNQLKRQLQAFGCLDRATEKRRERISDEVRLFVWQRDEGKCVLCGSNEKLEFDHIIPVVKGGNNTERNVQLLCERCNREKSSKL